jgi:hypothetical protein
MMTTATLTKIKAAQPMGEYTPTAVDRTKAGVDFRLINVGPNVIAWQDGRRERVTNRQLAKLQAAHTWATDF